MDIVFANDPEDQGSISGRVIPKIQTTVLDAFLFNTQHYKIRINGKWRNPEKEIAPSLTPRCSSYGKETLRVALDYSGPTYLTHIYIYVCVCVCVCVCEREREREREREKLLKSSRTAQEFIKFIKLGILFLWVSLSLSQTDSSFLIVWRLFSPSSYTQIHTHIFFGKYKYMSTNYL